MNNTIERFIKKHNLGPKLLVKFKGDNREYVIKNISPDRIHVFVTQTNELGVWRKKISDIIAIQRKPVSIHSENIKEIMISDNLENENASLETNNLEEILKGLKVEMEHTNSPVLAMEIVVDHLAENPTYYTALENPSDCENVMGESEKDVYEPEMNGRELLKDKNDYPQEYKDLINVATQFLDTKFGNTKYRDNIKRIAGKEKQTDLNGKTIYLGYEIANLESEAASDISNVEDTNKFTYDFISSYDFSIGEEKHKIEIFRHVNGNISESKFDNGDYYNPGSFSHKAQLDIQWNAINVDGEDITTDLPEKYKEMLTKVFNKEEEDVVN
jgi:hypothetical protein